MLFICILYISLVGNDIYIDNRGLARVWQHIVGLQFRVWQHRLASSDSTVGLIRVSRHNLVLPPDLGLQTRRFLDVACGDLELDFGDDVKDEDDKEVDHDEHLNIDDRIEEDEEEVNRGEAQRVHVHKT